MAGSGVRPANVLKIAGAGVDAVHFSARRTVESRMRFRNGAVSMGGIAGIPEYASVGTDEETIREILRRLA